MAKENLDNEDYQLDEEESNINFQDLEKRDSNMSGEIIPNFEPDDIERDGDRTHAAGDVVITDLLERLDDYRATIAGTEKDSEPQMADDRGDNSIDGDSQIKKKQKLFNLNYVEKADSGYDTSRSANKHRRRPRLLQAKAGYYSHKVRSSYQDQN